MSNFGLGIVYVRAEQKAVTARESKVNFGPSTEYKALKPDTKKTVPLRRILL